MPRQTAILLLVLLLAMLGLVIWSFFVPGSLDGMAQPHPDIANMLQSKSTAADSPIMVLIGSIFGILTLIIISITVWIGMLKGGQENALGRRMLWSWGIYTLIFVAIFWTYAQFIENPAEARFIGAFPVPTAWMMFGVWFFPLIFVGLYAAFFRTHVLTPEDEDTFNRLLQRSKQGEG